MDKVVILIEDDLNQIEDVMLSLQSILFVASKKGLPNAPQNGDTKICILHVLWNSDTADERRFQQFKRRLETRQSDFISEGKTVVPELNYSYKPIKLDELIYPKECEQCRKTISRQIEEICNDRDYTILLDVVLNVNKDTDIVLNSEIGSVILSQKLYNAYHEHCIPYSTYDYKGIVFRKKWKAGIDPSRDVYDRRNIDDNTIYKPFQKELYQKLNIGGDV